MDRVPIGIEHLVAASGEQMIAAMQRLLLHAQGVLGDDTDETLDFIVIGVPTSQADHIRDLVAQALVNEHEVETVVEPPAEPRSGGEQLTELDFPDRD